MVFFAIAIFFLQQLSSADNGKYSHPENSAETMMQPSGEYEQAKKDQSDPAKRYQYRYDGVIGQKQEKQELMSSFKLKKDVFSEVPAIGDVDVLCWDESSSFIIDGGLNTSDDDFRGKVSEVFVATGYIKHFQNVVDIVSKYYKKLNIVIDRVEESMGMSGYGAIDVNINDVPGELKSPLEQLMEVEGVEVEVPGTGVAVAVISGKAAGKLYDTGEKFFTIDDIKLKKKENGGLRLYIPDNARKDFQEKKLALNKNVDLSDGGTLAKVIVRWSKYVAYGFSFDKTLEEEIVKAVAAYFNKSGENAGKFETLLDMMVDEDGQMADITEKFIKYPEAAVSEERELSSGKRQ
ncbi:MAG: hypothetical protein ABIA77_01075 [Candidatus Omnitrophota bacterium]